MVLLVAIILGLMGGIIRAKISGIPMRTVALKYLWLVFLAFIPQFFAFYFAPTQILIPDNWIPFILVGTQFLLLLFAWDNRKTTGFSLLGLGLLCNFAVIALNKGFMPIPLETAKQLIPPGSDYVLEVGNRVGLGKDILLFREDTILWFLGDVFMLPRWLNYPLAFSVGDILISMGAIWLLWDLGRPQNNSLEESP